MPTDLFTDTLIHLMREVFAEETLAPEQRARIRDRVTSNLNVHGMELWANPAIPFDGAHPLRILRIRRTNSGCFRTLMRLYIRSNQPCLRCFMVSVSDASASCRINENNGVLFNNKTCTCVCLG